MMSCEIYLERELPNKVNRDSFPNLTDVEEFTWDKTFISSLVLVRTKEGGFVYKMRKIMGPDTAGVGDLLDFSTLEKRKEDCFREIEKNRPMAADLYLGVVPVVGRGDFLVFEAQGQPCEWAVKMRRFKEEDQMDNLLSREKISKEQILELARLIVRFHQSLSVPADVSQYGSLTNITRIWQENFDQAQKQLVNGALTQEMLDKSRRKIEHFLRKNESLFLRRIKEKKILDCHGDLHSGNVIFENGKPKPFDALEFNPAYSVCDVASEIAFMAMDLEFLGYPALAMVFVDEYLRLTEDREMKETGLLNFYKAHRAWVRGKVNCGQKDFVKARQYFQLALSYL